MVAELLALVLCLASWLWGRCASWRSAAIRKKAPLRAENPVLVQQRWARLVKGAQRLRQLRRLWHFLGEHLRQVKESGRCGSRPPASTI